MSVSDRPNVLLITTDHWPATLLGIAGHPHLQTPTLDQIARNGTRFTNAYSECPVCIPARRTLMTGTSPRLHGDRTFQTQLTMPEFPTLAETFCNAGYQATAVGKLHVYPQRDRIGFDDVILAEEGRPQWGVWDDYEVYLGDRGYAGRQFDHGMSNNEYNARPWHLPEDCHVTNWLSREMCRTIRRRDPLRPNFWYLSFTHPHPPLVPLQHDLDFYQQITPETPLLGNWASDSDSLPYALKKYRANWHVETELQIERAHRAFYALCMHIDRQLRTVIGTLREEGILDQTAILFTADHGDMLGTHGLWAKRLFYEGSANVPMLLMTPVGDDRVAIGDTDDRLVGLQDVMPTLCDLAGIPVPTSVTGQSLLGDSRRSHFYGECNEDATATRMIHDGRYKLVYYPVGHHIQLFDLQDDPCELSDLARSPNHNSIRQRLTKLLINELYGSDLDWMKNGELVGLPDQEFHPQPHRNLLLQRGIHWPPPPVVKD